MKSISLPFMAIGIILISSSCSKQNQTESGSGTVQATLKNYSIQSTGATKMVNGHAYKAVRYKVAYITDAASNQVGQTVYFKNVGNKRLGEDFVPGDPRRDGRTNITYTIDNETTADNGLTRVAVSAAIDRAMQTWDAVKCSNLNITKVPFNGNLGLFSSILVMVEAPNI